MRLRSLDSLRGIAAALVVLHHWVFTFWDDHIPFPSPTGLRQVAADVAYHFTTFGPASVEVFFVLSGLVLTLALERDHDSYQLFVFKRLIRIYPPYLASILFALLLLLILQPAPLPGVSPWFNSFWTKLPNPVTIVGHILMFGSPRFESLNSVSWSLVHEIRISIVFPIIVYLVSRSVWKSLAFALMISFVAIFLAGHARPVLNDILQTVFFAIAFFMGAAIALHLHRIKAWYDGLSAPARWLLFAVTFILLNIPAQILDGKLRLVTIGMGGAALVAICAVHPRISKNLEQNALLYLGRISYSLYLFHFPVLTATVYILYGRIPTPLVIFLGIAAIWLVSDLANRLVERPCQRFSHFLSTRQKKPHRLSPAGL